MKKLKELFQFRSKKLSTIIFTSFMVIGLTVISFVFTIQRDNYLNEIYLQSENDIYSYSQNFEGKITEISSDIFLVKQMIMTRDSFILDSGEVQFVSDHELTRIEVSLMDWMSVKTIYDQIRIIDLNGNEMVRVNYNNGSPAIVPEESLQDKSGRYYFENSIILDENNLYISKLDLNVEGGEIEIVGGEPKPVLRFATPLYNSDNEKIGVLVINYLAKDLLDSADTLRFGEYSNFEVLNNEGFYLKAIDDNDEFTFMYDESEYITYYDNHTIDILSIDSHTLEQIQYDGEFFTVISVTEESLTNSITNVLGSNVQVVNETERFVIVGEVELGALEEYKTIINLTILITILFIIISFIITRLIDGVNYYRNEQLITLEYTANHDALTNLPNRNQLFEDVSYKLSRNKQLAVLFMDFDGFKKINDEYGHDIGDLALIKGSQRIKNMIRRDDLLARVGGDEFVTILFDVSTKDVVDKVINKITSNFSTPFDLKGNSCKMGVSIGYSISKEGDSLDDLLKEADSMMYIKKEKNKK